MSTAIYTSLFRARAALAIAEALPAADATTRAGWLARLSEAMPAHAFGEIGCGEADIRNRLAGFERDDPAAFRATAATPAKTRDFYGCPDEATFRALSAEERISRVRQAEAEERAAMQATEKAGKPRHPETLCGMPAAAFQKLNPETRIALALKWTHDNPDQPAPM